MDLGPGWFILMSLVALFWTLVVIAAVWMLHSLARGHNPANVTAIDALDSRFARGEIPADEYRERRDALAAQA
jgi:uncharacterized membrane protein